MIPIFASTWPTMCNTSKGSNKKKKQTDSQIQEEALSTFVATTYNQENTSPTALATASCCLGAAISDASKLADLSGKTMSTACDMTSLQSQIFTGYIAGASVISSVKTAHKNQKYLNTIKELKNELEILENTPTQAAAFEFLSMLEEDIKFIRNVPGLMSAMASALIGAGVFTVFPVTLAGLLTGVVDAGCHAAKSASLSLRYQKQIEKIKKAVEFEFNADGKEQTFCNEEDKKIITTSLGKEKSLANKRLFGALLTVLGVVAITITMLSMAGMIMLNPSFVLAFTVVAILTVLAGIYISIKHSPYLDMTLRKKEIELFKKNFSDLNGLKKELIIKLRKAHVQKEISKKYQNKLAQKQSFIRSFFTKFLLFLPEMVTTITLNSLPDSWYSSLSRKAKEYVSDSINSISWQDRFFILKDLAYPNEKLQGKINAVALQLNLTEEEYAQKFSEYLQELPIIMGHVVRLMSFEGYDGKKLTSNYKKIFSSKQDELEAIEAFTYIKNFGECCDPYFDSDISKFSFEFNAEQRQIFHHKLKSRFDQFVIYSLENMNDKNLRVYSRIFGKIS